MRKITWISILATLCSLFCSAQDKSYYELIPYRKGKLWGYCDTLKRITIPPVYDYANWFKEQYNNKRMLIKKLAVVRKGKSME